MYNFSQVQRCRSC